MLRLALVTIATIGISISTASAETMQNFKIGNWFGGAYTNNATRAFDHCAANSHYKSGIYMGFSIDRNFHWTMRFTHPDWRLIPGQRFSVAFTVDNMSALPGVGIALNKTTVEVPLADSVELFSRFRRGYLLRVAAARQVFGFSLTGTSQLLPALLHCARNRGAPVQMATNPFAPKSNLPAANTRDDAKTGAEATAFAANLLSLAGVQGFLMLGPSDHPEIKGDARWISGSTFGAVNILANATADDMKNLSSILIGADAKACKGTFFSGAIPDTETGVMARIFTTCQLNGKPTTVYYLAVPRKSGGAYIISTLSLGSEEPAKKSDAELRTGVTKLLATYNLPQKLN